jgi:chromosome partitioning protein
MIVTQPEERQSKTGSDRPTIIVVGNEKGGTGKSTTAVHLAIGLLHRGYKVGTLDLDPRQATLTRYLENRKSYAETGPALLMPQHTQLKEITDAPEEDAELMARQQITDIFGRMAGCHVVIIDTPGSPSMNSRIGHEEADILITPVNDSLVDIDVLAVIDPVNRAVIAPSFYSQMAWEYHNRRIVDGRQPIDWMVIRNRLPHIQSHNRRDIDDLLEKLAQRMGFRVAPGLAERVVFRALFLKGLTVVDLPTLDQDWQETPSHRAARKELNNLLDSLNLPPRPNGASIHAISA